MFWLLPILNSFVKQYLTEAVRTKITSNLEKCIPPTVKKIIIMWIYGCIKGLLKIRDLVCLSVSNVFLTISKHKSLIVNLFALLKITWQLDLNISISPLFWWFISIAFVSNFDFVSYKTNIHSLLKEQFRFLEHFVKLYSQIIFMCFRVQK